MINSSIIKTEVYNYSLDNLKPDSIEILEGKAKTVLIYNSDGKVSEKKIYAEESLENEDENEKKYILNEEILCKARRFYIIMKVLVKIKMQRKIFKKKFFLTKKIFPFLIIFITRTEA